MSLINKSVAFCGRIAVKAFRSPRGIKSPFLAKYRQIIDAIISKKPSIQIGGNINISPNDPFLEHNYLLRPI